MDPLKAQPPEAKLHFLDYWRINRIRKTVILAVFLLVDITATLVTDILTESFSSTARIKVERDTADIPGMVDTLTDDVQFKNVDKGEVTVETRSRDELAELARFWVSAFRSRRQTVTHSITVLNRTMVTIDYEAVLAADLPNGWKAGQELSFPGATYFELRDGRIARIVDQT